MEDQTWIIDWINGDSEKIKAHEVVLDTELLLFKSHNMIVVAIPWANVKKIERVGA